MLRHGCDDKSCKLCRRGKDRPTVYAARVFAQHYVVAGRKVCPRVAEMCVPLINFARPNVSESLIMRVRCGKIPEVATPVAKPNIGIMVRPHHVQKHKQKVKEQVREKPVVNAGQYKLRKLTSQSIEKVLIPRIILMQVIEITNDTKDDSFLRQILESLSDIRVLADSFRDPPRMRTHRNIITNKETVNLMFDELDRRHLPLLFNSLHRALRDIDNENISYKEEIHCLHLGWQALATSENALEIGGMPLAVSLVEIGTQEEGFQDRFGDFCAFLTNYELLIAKPIIRIIQSLLVYDWHDQIVVDGFRAKCLLLLKSLYQKNSKNPYLSPFFVNPLIAKSALSEQNQRSWAAAFTHEGETLLDHNYLFSHSDKIALFDFWVVAHMEHQHKEGWGIRRMARHFQNLGFRSENSQSAYFGIAAERQDILHDVTKAITGQSISVLRRPMKVRYAGEQGIDLAGLTADLLAKVIKASITRCLDLNLLRERTGIWFQEGADNPGEFHRLGMLIGLAMYNGVKSLPLDFPPMFYKKLVDEPLDLEDMKEFDPILYQGWRKLSDSDVNGLAFEYTYQIGSEIETHILEYEGKESKLVTPDNFQSYIQAMFNASTNTLITSSFNALRSGLESIIPRRVLKLFSSSQLQALMAGQRVVDVSAAVELLKQVTVYDGYSPDDPIIKSLWQILSNSSPTLFSFFLDLVTASDRIPASFPANFKLTIFKSGSDEEM